MVEMLHNTTGIELEISFVSKSYLCHLFTGISVRTKTIKSLIVKLGKARISSEPYPDIRSGTLDESETGWSCCVG